MRAVYDISKLSIPVGPRLGQRSAWRAHAEVHRVLKYLWTLVVLTFGRFLSVLIVVKVCPAQCQIPGERSTQHSNYINCKNVYRGNSWSILHDSTGVTSTVKITTVDDACGTSRTGLSPEAATMVVLPLIMGFQGAITTGMHCAELLVTLSCHEDT